MIPYDELCEALARYRTRHGMANGPSASPPRGPGQVSSPPPAVTSQPTRSSGDYPAQRSASGEYPVASGGFIQAATREDYPGGPGPDDRTDIHTPAAPREDPTGEIDIDTVDVVEEDDA